MLYTDAAKLERINICSDMQKDPHGFVELMEVMGSIEKVVKVAGVSYGKNEVESEEDRQKRIITTLLAKKHLSPFEHLVFTFHIKLPIFVMRHLVRHRIASVNEKSGRYTAFNVRDFWIPDFDRIQGQANRDLLVAGYEQAFKIYEHLLANGVKKEVARAVLPVAAYTEIYWTVNARSLMNFFDQRLAKTAQYETREYAQAVLSLVSRRFPLVFQHYAQP